MKYSLRSLMRFSIRDLFWLTVVVGVALGWWVNHQSQVKFRQNIERGIQSLTQRMVQDGYKVGWDGQQNLPIIVGPRAVPDSSASAADLPNP